MQSIFLNFKFFITLVHDYFVTSLNVCRPECYDLLKHNCNTFSNEVVEFLVGRPIPDYIINLPNEVLDRQELFYNCAKSLKHESNFAHLILLYYCKKKYLRIPKICSQQNMIVKHNKFPLYS